MTNTEGAFGENFTSMSREFSALVLARSSIDPNNDSPIDVHDNERGNNLGRIGEEDLMEETNPLAIVPDNHPLDPNTEEGRSCWCVFIVGGGSGKRRRYLEINNQNMYNTDEEHAKARRRGHNA
ncbi:remorin 4.2-like [Prosopis cineraria]|uniref:remorin 4.2-like n=1 Tax=Prosopis cineraria TaxID=364024 RepID=UPI00241034D4|nr:remorin 4.2-like [Prosopis cineraria]